MPDLLTTEEAATYLRLSERKLYELVAKNAVPCTKVTGRWLFPRAALDRWVMAGLITPTALAHVGAPPIVGGSHDPLLEWALRESDCGLASLPEGSQEGLRRLARGEVMIAAIHLHTFEGDDERANIVAASDAPGLHDAVVIAFARREQGIVVAPGNPLGLSDIVSIAKSGARLAQRPPGAGAQLLLLALLARAGIAADELALVKPVCATGTDIAQAVRSGRRLRNRDTFGCPRCRVRIRAPHFESCIATARLFLARPAGFIRFHSIGGPAGTCGRVGRLRFVGDWHGAFRQLTRSGDHPCTGALALTSERGIVPFLQV